ncbi:BgTH12-01040 [Blumeria graminis f. sp. triticale]|uniref:BgTH12-01040 n=1 Tax=Blumeria graminis f. sp. triticale TaxID=1689686 RepID=A0A9W4GJ46_BLUGR|nr:BgTH12-01040 [Blumeria graminis f. sp. triticale]
MRVLVLFTCFLATHTGANTLTQEEKSHITSAYITSAPGSFKGSIVLSYSTIVSPSINSETTLSPTSRAIPVLTTSPSIQPDNVFSPTTTQSLVTMASSFHSHVFSTTTIRISWLIPPVTSSFGGNVLSFPSPSNAAFNSGLGNSSFINVSSQIFSGAIGSHRSHSPIIPSSADRLAASLQALTFLTISLLSFL